MAATNSNLSHTTTPIYRIADGVTEGDIHDQLLAKSGQLVAMLHMVTGEGSCYFSRTNQTLRDNFLWSCKQMAQECHDLASQL